MRINGIASKETIEKIDKSKKSKKFLVIPRNSPDSGKFQENLGIPGNAMKFWGIKT